MILAIIVVIFSAMMFYWGKLYGINVTVKQQNDDLLRTIEKCEKHKEEKNKQ